MKRLLCYDHLKSSPVNDENEWLDLRQTVNSEPELMDVYETFEPHLISVLRKAIEEASPQEIVVIGSSDSYRWLATVVSRVFGRFNSWLGQYENAFAITEITVNQHNIKLYAFDTYEAWRNYHEETN